MLKMDDNFCGCATVGLLGLLLVLSDIDNDINTVQFKLQQQASSVLW